MFRELGCPYLTVLWQNIGIFPVTRIKKRDNMSYNLMCCKSRHHLETLLKPIYRDLVIRSPRANTARFTGYDVSLPCACANILVQGERQ